MGVGTKDKSLTATNDVVNQELGVTGMVGAQVSDPLYITVGGTASDSNDIPDFASTDLFGNGVVFQFRTGGE